MALICVLVACGADAVEPAPAGNGGVSGASSGGMSSMAGSGAATGGTEGASTGGMSGGAAGVGGAGGAGGSGGAAPAGTSRTEACIAYEVARSARYAFCFDEPVKTDDTYARAAEACPDIYFSEGSTRTVDGLLACAEVFRTLDCSVLLLNDVPDCVSDGTVGAGEPCAFGPQCASLICLNTVVNGCGTCAQRREPGEACDYMTEFCAPGYGCIDGMCEANEPIEPGEPIDPIDPNDEKLPTGAACMETIECTAPDLCLPNDVGMLVCTARVPLNGSCSSPTAYCDEETYCNEASVCTALPGDGEPCGLSFGEPRWCAAGLACDVLDPAGATCKPMLGGACAVAGFECEEGKVCCSEPECAEPTCLSVLLPGEACGADGTRCITGTECTNGSCEPIESRGVFETACMP